LIALLAIAASISILPKENRAAPWPDSPPAKISAQDPPVQPPAPPVILTIEGPKHFEPGQFIDFEAKGGKGKAIRWRLQNASGDPLKDPDIRYRNDEKGVNKRLVELESVPGKWTLMVTVSNDETIEDAFHTFTIGGTLPPTDPTDPDVPPVKPKTLSELAGPQAAPVGLVYKLLRDDVGKGTTSMALFFPKEKAALDAAGVTGHGATAEITKRLADITFDDLATTLDVIIAELALPVVSPATAATYVYEKDDGMPNSAVMVGLDRLNREKKIRATLFEDDTVDGDGQVPDQYKVALEAAKAAGLPALVVTNGEKVVNVVVDRSKSHPDRQPLTTEQVFGAAL